MAAGSDEIKLHLLKCGCVNAILEKIEAHSEEVVVFLGCLFLRHHSELWLPAVNSKPRRIVQGTWAFCFSQEFEVPDVLMKRQQRTRLFYRGDVVVALSLSFVSQICIP